MDGWIKLYRQAIDDGWLQNADLWAFWCYCLLKATHKKHTARVGYQRIDLAPGQFIFGRKKAAEELETTERKIRTSLKILEKEGNVTIKTTNKFSVITICNWEAYQLIDNGIDQQDDQQTTNRRPASDQQVTTYKNDKKVKNDKKKDSVSKKPKRRKSSWTNSPLPMNCDQFVVKMLESSQRHVQIIGHLADEMKPGLETKGQWQVFFNRYKKEASVLVPFTDKQLAYGTREAIKNHPEIWTLETIKKEIVKRKGATS